MQDVKAVMALDIGSSRIGVALARLDSRIAQPLTTIDRSEGFVQKITDLINEYSVTTLVCGQPRGLDGQETQQTHDTLDFIKQLKNETSIEIVLQDEAMTSKKAESELIQRGKPYQKGDIDALAATYILDDFLQVRVG